MNLVLFRKTAIVTNLTEAEIINRLTRIVNLKRREVIFSLPDYSKQYEGEIKNNHFKIHRVVKGRNSFIPIIDGKIIDNLSTRVIELKMNLHFIVVLFLLFVSGFTVYSLIGLNEFAGLVLLGFIFGITIFFFNQECDKSTKDFNKLLMDNF